MHNLTRVEDIRKKSLTFEIHDSQKKYYDSELKSLYLLLSDKFKNKCGGNRKCKE